MTKAEKIELILIVAAAFAAWLLAHYFVPTLKTGEMWMLIASLLLLQGLIRDLYLLNNRRRNPACVMLVPVQVSPGEAPQPVAPKQCMCLESTFGTIGIAIGAALLLLGSSNNPVSIPPVGWMLIVLATCGLGFLLKNVVIDWKRRRLAIVKDHSKVTF